MDRTRFGFNSEYLVDWNNGGTCKYVGGGVPGRVIKVPLPPSDPSEVVAVDPDVGCKS
jgi:hypothetical protein